METASDITVGEQSYRRGWSHGFLAVLSALREAEALDPDTLEDLAEWEDIVMDWRESSDPGYSVPSISLTYSLSPFQKEIRDARNLAKYYENRTSIQIENRHTEEFRRLLKKYSVEEIYAAIDASSSQYLVPEGEWFTQESLHKTFEYVSKICASKRKTADKPYLADLNYIMGILRNRLTYVPERWKLLPMLEEALQTGTTTDEIKQIALSARNWTIFREGLTELMEREAE